MNTVSTSKSETKQH